MIMTVIILVLATLVLSAVLLAEISPDWLVAWSLQIAVLGILIILLGSGSYRDHCSCRHCRGQVSDF